MKLGRVLATTALVAVLLGSLFSGWLANSSIKNISVAHAQTYDLNTLKGWFPGHSIDDTSNPPIVVNESKTLIPFITVHGTDKRPDLVFKLFRLHAVGATDKSNMDYYLFQAYTIAAPQLQVPNLYIIISDANHLWFSLDNRALVFTPSTGHTLEDIIGGLDSIEPGGGQSITIPDSMVELEYFGYDLDSYKNFQRYIYKDPGASNDNWNCAGATNLVVPGPPPNTITKLPNPPDGHLWGELNGNCLGTGWTSAWGVQVDGSPITAANCGITGFISGGASIGIIITKVIACTVESLINGVLGPAQTYTKSLANATQGIECKLKNNQGEECIIDGKAGPNPDPLVVAWKYSLGLVNVAVIIALLLIAFANILHLNINTYTAKKALPGLVIGVIGANASLLLMRFVLDIVQAVTALAYQITNTANLGALVGKFIEILGGGASQISLVNIVALPFALFVVIIAVVYFIVLIVGFAWALLKRLVWLYFLVVTAPLAFVAYGIPNFQQWFTKWWDQFLRQAFVLPIIFIAVAIFIKYGEALGFANISSLASGTNPTPADIFSIALMFVAATLILKLPGAITKGAIDVTNAAKNAFGIAKNAPGNTWAVGQGMAGKRADLLKFQREKAEKAGNTALASQLKVREGRAKRWRDTFEGARGRAYIATNPDKTIKSWWEARTAAGEKGSSLAASKVNAGAGEDAIFPLTNAKLNISDVLAGRAGGYTTKRDVARKIFNEEAASPEEAMETASAAQGSIKAIESVLATKTPEEAMKVRRLLAGAKKENQMADMQTRLIDMGVNRSDLLGKGLFAEGQLSAFYEYIVKESSKNRVTKQDEQDRRIKGWIGSSGGGTPFGGGPDNPPGGRDGNGGVQDVRVINPVTLSPDGEAFASQIQQHAQALMDNLDEGTLNAINEKLVGLNAPEAVEALGGEAGAALKSQLGSLVDIQKLGGTDLVKLISSANGQQLKQLASMVSIAASSGGNMDVIRQHLVSAGRISNQVDEINRDAGTKFDEKKLAEAINGPLEGLVNHLSENLSGNFDQLNQTLGKTSNPADKDRAMRAMAEELKQAISGPGQRSLRGIIDTMGSRMAKQMGLAHLSLGQRIMQASATQPDIVIEPPPAPAPTTEPSPPQPQSPPSPTNETPPTTS